LKHLSKVDILSTPCADLCSLSLNFYTTCKTCGASLERSSNEYVDELLINTPTKAVIWCECGVSNMIKYKLTLNCEVYEDGDREQ